MMRPGGSLLWQAQQDEKTGVVADAQVATTKHLRICTCSPENLKGAGEDEEALIVL